MRFLSRVAAVLLILLGVPAVIAAAAAIKVVGSDNVVMLPAKHLRTDGAAIATAEGLLSVYDTTLHVRATAQDPKTKLWIGAADQGDLKNYLGATSRSVITRYAFPDTLTVDQYAGLDEALTAPRKLDWWLADGHGEGRAELAWPIPDGNYRVLIMNADGKPGVDVDLELGLQIEGIHETALLLLVGGTAAIVLGVVIFVLTRKRRVRVSSAPTGGEA